VSFVAFIMFVLALDLGVFHKKSHTVSFKEAIMWSIVWIALAMAFNVVILYWRGQEDFMLFLSGYVIEKSLSVDNLFVFLLIFSYFKVPNEYQHKILFYGILGALVMRAAFIGAGIAIIRQFSWVIYLFGGFLIITGLKMLKPSGDEPDLEKNKIIVWAKKIFPTSHNLDGDKFFTVQNGKRMVTPLFITLIFVEISDVVFAIDSIPAIIGITDDPFLVFTSNVFAILGLRSMYFFLANMLEKFSYLEYSLIIILTFVGIKMIAHDYMHLPEWASLTFIVICLVGGVLYSLYANQNAIKQHPSRDEE
jgi:tellurite resistance protein TerC